MTVATRPSVRPIWGQNNTTSADMVDPGDSFIDTGWPLSAQPPSRQTFNFLENYLWNGIRYFSRRGISDWNASEVYVQGDIAIASNGIVFQAIAGNTNAPPQSSPASWGGLNGYALTGALGGFVTTAQLTSTLAAYVTQASLTTQLGSYATVAALNAKSASDIATAEAFTTASLANFVSNSALTARLAGFVTTAGLTSALANYATLAALNNFVTLAQRSADFVTLENFAVAQGAGAVASANAFTNAQTISVLTATQNGDLKHIPDTAGRVPIDQWGVNAGIPNSPGARVTFPIKFPNACLNVTATAFQQNATVTILEFDATGFDLINGVSGLCTWRATGW